MLVQFYLTLYFKAPPCTADPFCQMKGSPREGQDPEFEKAPRADLTLYLHNVKGLEQDPEV